jgi:multidrug efflux system membrane fusion protein
MNEMNWRRTMAPLQFPHSQKAPVTNLKNLGAWTGMAMLVTLAVVGLSCSRKPPQAQAGKAKAFSAPPLMIATAAAQKGDIGIYVNALGVVTPRNTVSVKSRVDGQLVKVNYQEGQLIHAGDALVEIDPTPYQAALLQAEGQFARDSALLENAHLDLDRYKEAFAKNAIPRQLLDTQLATVHQYDGTVKLDQGQVDNARVQLGYCRIAAPISGRVGLRLVDAGNIVHASDANPLVVITELQPITIIFSVAEDYLPQIQKQLLAGRKLTVDAFDRAQTKKIAAGELETLDNQIDTTTGTIRLKAIFANEDGALFPNQFVNARLLVNMLHDATLMPNAAIQRNAQGAFVYLLKPDQTVAMQSITVGTTDGNVSAIEGLEPGVVVAADNFSRLTDGAAVQLRPTATNEMSRGTARATNRTEAGADAPKKNGRKNNPQ